MNVQLSPVINNAYFKEYQQHADTIAFKKQMHHEKVKRKHAFHPFKTVSNRSYKKSDPYALNNQKQKLNLHTHNDKNKTIHYVTGDSKKNPYFSNITSPYTLLSMTTCFKIY